MTKEVVLITGASSGIGRALAFEFARHGHGLVLVARETDGLATVQSEIEAAAREAHRAAPAIATLAIDLLDPTALEQIYQFCQEQRLTVTTLINNAGIGAEGDFAELAADRQQRIIDLDVSTVVQMCHRFLPAMRRRHAGTIVNISSTTAFMPLAGETVYAAAKAFVLSFTQALYEENRRYGVAACALCPGVTQTNFFQNAGFELQNFKAASPADFAAFAYRQIQAQRPLAIHRFSNQAIALWARLFSRGSVGRMAARWGK